MGMQRIVRVNEILKREIAESLYRVLDPTAFDHSAVTITRVITSADLQHARVMVSIRAPAARQRLLLEHLRRHRGAIQAFFSKHVTLRYTPHLIFEIDESIVGGDHVLSMIAQLEVEKPELFEEPPPDASEGTPPETPMEDRHEG